MNTLILGLLLLTAASTAPVQDGENLRNWLESPVEPHLEEPSVELQIGDARDLIETAKTELRYRMIVTLFAYAIVAVLGLAALHWIQVKFKINRGYFWFMVVFVCLGLLIKNYPSKAEPVPSRSPPSYAPMRAR